MPIVTLTDRFCATVSVPKSRTDYFDQKTKGLALRVAPSGVRTFTLHFSAPNGKRARLTLGRYPRISLATARRMALEGQGRADSGEDPRHGAAATLNDLAADYLSQHVKPNLRSAKAIERRLTKNVLSIIGNVPLSEFHKRDVNRVVAPVLERKRQAEAARVFEDVRALLRWGVARGDLDFNPMEGMRRPSTRGPRERVLSEDEIVHLWNGLDEAFPRSEAVRKVIKLCLLTGQRVGEVAGIVSAEIDGRKRQWTIPATRSKNGRSHVVPLTEEALELAKEIACGEKVPAHAVAKTIRLAQDRVGIAQWTAHDLRRSVVTYMAELGVSPIVLGHVINHRSVTRAGVTLAVYQQYDYAKEKRQALELWAARLAAIVGDGAAKVLPMRSER